jgi:nitric oxide reductase NorQ protein
MLDFIETRSEISVFEACYKSRLPLLLKGPTGCGKSHLVEYMAQKLDRPLVKVACNEDTNAADLLGRFIIKGGETIWQDGPISRAIRNSAILYIDEIAEAREDVIVAVHPLTDFRREIYLDKTNEVLRAADDFMFVASFNPGYQSSLREMKPSTKQRFVSLAMDYLSVEKEKELLKKSVGASEDLAQKLALLAKKIRESENFSLRETVSTRLLIHAVRLHQAGINIRAACHMAIGEALTDDRAVVKAVNEFINLHI